ncbi:hypothetical protein P0D88_50480 [Paraburkholderia sp. RL18-103-BIB-C]|uniref:hypothetical protein n=1 Tax=unclassified Paraburkholderia TaxID=2615204 RepID=UPI0038BCAA52
MAGKRSAVRSAKSRNDNGCVLDAPVFSQPQPMPDPQTFVVRHASDAAAYKVIDELNREHTHWSNA